MNSPFPLRNDHGTGSEQILGLTIFLRAEPFEKWAPDDRGQLLVAGVVRMIAIA